MEKLNAFCTAFKCTQQIDLPMKDNIPAKEKIPATIILKFRVILHMQCKIMPSGNVRLR